MTARERFAQNLRNLRKHSGKTQQEVADMLCVKRGSYSGYENGVAEPSYEMLVTIASYYGQSLDTLLKREITLASKLDYLYQSGSRLMIGIRTYG